MDRSVYRQALSGLLAQGRSATQDRARQFRARTEDADKRLATSISFTRSAAYGADAACARPPWLLSIIAGACAMAGANIVDAQIYTTTDGLALDTISLSREFDRDEDEERRGTASPTRSKRHCVGSSSCRNWSPTGRHPKAVSGLSQWSRSHYQQPVVSPLHDGRSHGPRSPRSTL